ncbi:MAG: hypothetical protein RE472_03210 [Thermoplasmatales archaeon]|nr:MAG: hypothetical protein RE472_09715 [Thermoplasmatales archaeon]WMT49988.1 MAG: hypothetical protein RE472_03210 [Thermoplasmatales archaeon]
MPCSMPVELFDACESPDLFGQISHVVISHTALGGSKESRRIGAGPV